MKETANKLDFIEIKNTCSAKYTAKRMGKKQKKKQATDWEKYFQITYLIKDLYPEKYRTLKV